MTRISTCSTLKITRFENTFHKRPGHVPPSRGGGTRALNFQTPARLGRKLVKAHFMDTLTRATLSEGRHAGITFRAHSQNVTRGDTAVVTTY